MLDGGACLSSSNSTILSKSLSWEQLSYGDLFNCMGDIKVLLNDANLPLLGWKGELCIIWGVLTARKDGLGV